MTEGNWWLIEHGAYLGRPDSTTESSELAACGGDDGDGIDGRGSAACSSFALSTPLASFLLTPARELRPLIYSEITTLLSSPLLSIVYSPLSLTKNPH